MSPGSAKAPNFITAVRSIEEARNLPRGAVVGDLHGGVTFTDAVAAVLEQRSSAGWTKLDSGFGSNHWTIIVLNR